MITIRVSEGVAFDMHAIADIKVRRTHGRDDCLGAYYRLETDIAAAIGQSMLHQVTASDEYVALHQANSRVFDLIDEMHRQPKFSHGVAIDQQNHTRYLAKVALQKRWFPETPIGEVKIGYETPVAAS